VAEETESNNGRLIDQKYPTGFRKDRREAVFLFCALIAASVCFWPLADIR
jgi:hypothetical protein